LLGIDLLVLAVIDRFGGCDRNPMHYMVPSRLAAACLRPHGIEMLLYLYFLKSHAISSLHGRLRRLQMIGFGYFVKPYGRNKPAAAQHAVHVFGSGCN
jgi:hypothetical protein